MNKTNERILNKAISYINTQNFNRAWDNLFETSTEQTNNLICNLYFMAMRNEALRYAIRKHSAYMPTMLVKALNYDMMKE